jgi:hypothetical protein
MSEDVSPEDAALLARLGAIALTVDAPPAAAFDAGRAAFAWRTVDAELAELVADSALETATVRSAATDTRLLSFETGRWTIEVQLSIGDGRRAVLGQVIPEPATAGATARIETDTADALEAHIDAMGRFDLDDVAGTRLRIRVEVPGSPPVTTVWVGL